MSPILMDVPQNVAPESRDVRAHQIARRHTAKLLQSDVDWLRNAWLSRPAGMKQCDFINKYRPLMQQELRVSVSAAHMRGVICNDSWFSLLYARLLLARVHPDRLALDVTAQLRARYERLRHDYRSKVAFAVDAQVWLRTEFGLDIPVESIQVALSREAKRGFNVKMGFQLYALLKDRQPRTEGQIRTHLGWSRGQWDYARRWLRRRTELHRRPVSLANDSGYAWEYSLADQERGR